MDLVAKSVLREHKLCLSAPLKSFTATPREATCHVTTAHALFLLLLGTRHVWTCLLNSNYQHRFGAKVDSLMYMAVLTYGSNGMCVQGLCDTCLIQYVVFMKLILPAYRC